MAAKQTKQREKKTDIEPLTPGLYSYHTDPDSPDQFRLHLRVEPDGEGILVINASVVLHLNRSATEFAYYLIQGKDNVQIVDILSERYDVTREVLMRDVQLFIDQILFLSRKKDLSPSATIGFESHVFEKNLSAPLRIDCCLTYRSFNEKDDASLTANELTTEDWKRSLPGFTTRAFPT